MDVVGDPNRRSGRPFDQPVHKHLAAPAAETVVFVEAGEQVVRLVDDDDRLSRHTADRAGDQQRRDPLAPVGLGVFIVVRQRNQSATRRRSGSRTALSRRLWLAVPLAAR